MFDKTELKFYGAVVFLLVFDVFFADTNIVFSLVNSSEIALLLTGILLVAVIVGVNVLGIKYIVRLFDVNENPNGGEKE